MLRCFAIAQADAHVTNEIIRIGTTEVRSMVPMWPKDDYKQKLTRDLKLSEFDNLLRNCNNEAKSAGFILNLTSTVDMDCSIEEGSS